MGTEAIAIDMEDLKVENKKLFSVIRKSKQRSNNSNYSQDYTVSYSQGYCVGFFCHG